MIENAFYKNILEIRKSLYGYEILLPYFFCFIKNKIIQNQKCILIYKMQQDIMGKTVSAANIARLVEYIKNEIGFSVKEENDRFIIGWSNE